MRQFLTIAANAFMELVRQPVFLLLSTSSALFVVFLASIPYFGFGDDPKLAKESALAVMLLSGLLGAVLFAANSIAREIRTGTALAVLSKPVGRARFLLAKYAGLAAAMAALNYINTVAALYASRMAYDAYGDVDLAGVALWCACIALAYAAGGFSNYFLRRPFASDATLSLVVFVTLAFLINAALPKANPTARTATLGAFQGVDWRMIPAATLVLFALWILAALAVASSTRFELMSTLALCSAFFLLGLMSDYLFSDRAAAGSAWATLLYAVVPNWQLMWVANALDAGKAVPWNYVVTAAGYMVSYVGAALAVALWLFEDRELA